ncbi:MAG: hypothetical protein GIW95_05880, partial [Candidatus Eremiobacteraeota bacterium]|nr:hypothetical protein [Candidatus Eremiobacteraeota bacterium]
KRVRSEFAARSERFDRAVRALLDRPGRRLERAAGTLNGNDPEGILQKGYAIVTHRGAIVRDPAAVGTGETIEARVARGTMTARVETVRSDGDQRSG